MNKVGFVEYCPRCGRINPDPACQDCATHAVMMPTAIAEQAQAGFKASTQFVGWPEINKEPLGIKAPRPFDPMNAPSGFVAVQKETGERCALCSFSNDRPACAAAPCQPDARPDESWAYFSPAQNGEPGGLTVSPEQAEREVEKPAASAEPVAWAHFAKNGNIRIWTSAAKEAVRIAKENGIDLMPLYPAPQPDRVAELTAEVERLRTLIGELPEQIPDPNIGGFAWMLDGSERFCGIESSEEIAHGKAMGYCEAGMRYQIGRVAHPVDLAIGGDESRKRIAEYCAGEIDMLASEATGAEDETFDLSDEDLRHLGELIYRFVRSRSKAIWYGWDESTVTTHVCEPTAGKEAQS